MMKMNEKSIMTPSPHCLWVTERKKCIPKIIFSQYSHSKYPLNTHLSPTNGMQFTDPIQLFMERVLFMIRNDQHQQTVYTVYPLLP